MTLIPSDAMWPPLHLAEWADTYATLHMCTQIAGKIRLALTPRINHWWNTALYLTARGLTTSPIHSPGGIFQIDFDLVDHNVYLRKSDGCDKALPLVARPVADFYDEIFVALDALGIDVDIWNQPVEVPRPIPFSEDREHASYDPEKANRLLRALLSIQSVFQEFRGRFTGKASPIHFFWGPFDLAMTFFNGRRTDARAHSDRVTREAYSHECISFGFWPGAPGVTEAAFYSYTFPEPTGYKEALVEPPSAYYHGQLSEFILPYENVRMSHDPRRQILDFLRTCYDTGATLGRWDRESLERPEPELPAPTVEGSRELH